MISILEYLINNHVEKTDDSEVISVGSILCYDCGWNCNLPVFLRVVSITKSGASCEVEELQTKMVSGDWMYGEEEPDLDKPARPGKKKYRIQTYYDKYSKKNKQYIKVDKHWAELWDGKPMTRTSD